MRLVAHVAKQHSAHLCTQFMVAKISSQIFDSFHVFRYVQSLRHMAVTYAGRRLPVGTMPLDCHNVSAVIVLTSRNDVVSEMFSILPLRGA